ncbi:C45 family autoproteolytic acyltransferase/hydolase [Candidatus Uabimicrobium sp. HlEnr_7]|uniref:C45 family autoproteolytic acyltransferase/hydolase n=1 Tax=Candidatus Uabimicrobium helgolandensis TaxID=3095367 RepID=UPI0035588D09
MIITNTPWIQAPEINIDIDKSFNETLTKYGEELQTAIDDLLSSVSAEILNLAPNILYLAHIVNLRTSGRFFREAKAVAQVSGGDWRVIMMMGMAYELMALACSTTAIATDIGPVLARNMDFWPERELARNTFKITKRKNGEFINSCAGWPGALGVVTGLSGKGFAFALNAVWSSERLRKTGYPVLLFLRKVLDNANSYEEAVKMLTKQKLMSACLITLVGKKNEERIVIERTPSKAYYRKPKGDEALITTNHYCSNIDAKENANVLAQTSCKRFDTMSCYCAFPEYKNPSDELILSILNDQDIMQGITVQHIIARPAEQKMFVGIPKRLRK